MREFATLDLPAGTLVIGDLHLDPAELDAAHPFFAFLYAIAGRSSLVVLGDLFDAWIGPAHARLPGAARVVAALRAASDRGLAIRLIPGNRDFLLDADFSARTGVELFQDGFVARTPTGARVLLLHGDELCTLDLGYQRLKRFVRSPGARWLAPRLPDALALGLARRIRRASTRAIAAKPMASKQQQAGEVQVLAVAAEASALVCGHAHVFRDQRLPDGPRWVVVDAFGGPCDVLELGPAGELVALASSHWAAPGTAQA